MRLMPISRPGREHDGALDRVLELPDVARPVVALEERERVGTQLEARLVVLAAVLVEEAVREQGHVLPSLAQRRQLDHDHVQPVEEIFPKGAVVDEALQIDVRRRDDAHVDLDGIDAAQSHELALLDDPQELRLGVEGHGADLVEEDAALVCELEQALLGCHGTREGSLDVSEQVRFQQVGRETPGVHGDEGPLRPR